MDLGNWQTQLRKGLLDVVVLNLLRHGERHGYDMVQTLKQIDGLKVREGNIYPILARLMAGRQATSLVHFIPVFGEKGALLEHWIFDAFFNLPISVGRKLRRKASRAGAEDTA